MKQQFEYFTIQAVDDIDGTHYAVYGWTPYPETSVLAGQMAKVFQGSFHTLAEAEVKFPDAQHSNPYMERTISLGHLPGEDDFCAGGAYPDDYPDGDFYDFEEDSRPFGEDSDYYESRN